VRRDFGSASTPQGSSIFVQEKGLAGISFGLFPLGVFEFGFLVDLRGGKLVFRF